jgi:hypothetical protein
MQFYFSGKHLCIFMSLTALCLYFFYSESFFFLCRGDDGELKLGVRRAVQLKNEALFKAFSSNSAKIHTLSSVANSLKHRSVFHISYNPRFVNYECTFHFYVVRFSNNWTWFRVIIMMLTRLLLLLITSRPVPWIYICRFQIWARKESFFVERINYDYNYNTPSVPY